ncbi:EF-P lysine aminoacylase GenX [bacterium]|nr:EF-P lysine aminoacylase GenX [bacterium]
MTASAHPASDPWWSPHRHRDRRPGLVARSRALASVRAWFDREGFLETDVGAVVLQPGAELHTAAIRAGAGYLHTSPELSMKKLLAAGERNIFFLGKCYRAGETGPLHAPEFTMLEWYRAEAPLHAIMEDAAAMLGVVAAAAGAGPLRWRGRSCDPVAEPERLTVAEAFQRYADVDLLGTLMPADPEPGAGDRNALAAAAARIGVPVRPDDGWSDLLSVILTDRVEPRLGLGRPTILYDYPAPEAALARRNPDDPRIARRFELYACGVELANGFDELVDPIEQRARFAATMARKRELFGEAWPIDEGFLAALADMPPASGCALGFDRLLTLALGAPRLADALWSPPFHDGTGE